MYVISIQETLRIRRPDVNPSQQGLNRLASKFYVKSVSTHNCAMINLLVKWCLGMSGLSLRISMRLDSELDRAPTVFLMEGHL